MSNRKLAAVAAALIVGVVASVAWFLVGEAAAQRAQIEERRPPVLDRPSSALHLPSSVRVAHQEIDVAPCPCKGAQQG